SEAIPVAAARPEIRPDDIRVRRQPERLVVLDVAHVPVVEQPVPAAQHVVPLAVDVPGGVHAWQRARRPVLEDALRRTPRIHVADTVQQLEGTGIQKRSGVRLVEVRIEVATLTIQLPVVRPVTDPDAVLQREVRADLPAVLRERVEIPVPEFAEGLAAG